jgi:hypothetical protein
MVLNSFFLTLFFICGSFSADFLLKKIRIKNRFHKILLDCSYFSVLIILVLFFKSANPFYVFILNGFLFFIGFIILEEVKEIQIFNSLKSRFNFFSECLVEVRLGSSFKHAAKTHLPILNPADRHKIIKTIQCKSEKKLYKGDCLDEEVALLLNQSGSQLNSLQSILDKLKIEIKLRQRSREILFKNKLQMVFVIILYLLFSIKTILSENTATSFELLLSTCGILLGVFLMHLNSYRWKWTV